MSKHHSHDALVLSPFENTTFMRLFSAQITSLVGSGFTQVALALLAFDLMGLQAAVILGFVWSSRVLASVIFAPIFGGLVHRLPRKAWLIGLDLSRAIVVFSLFWVTDVWLLCALIFSINILSAGFTPVFQAILPDVFEGEAQYTRALGYSRIAYELERILSPALAGAALLLLSYNYLFLFNALSFVVSAIILAMTPFPITVVGERLGGIWHNISYGVNAYLRTPRLQGLLALQLVVAATGALVIINTVAYVQGDLGLTEQATVWVMAASGVGAMLSARLTPWLLENHINDRPLVLLAAVLMILPLIPLCFTKPDVIILAILWAIIGFASSIILTTSGRLITRSCHKADRSAFFSANFALSHLMWLLCYPLAGWLGTYGLSAAALGFTVVGVLGLGLAVWRWPADDVENLKHHHPELDHLHPHYHDEHHQHHHQGWEGKEPHVHPHYHPEIQHSHRFVIDEHHSQWPRH
ncbi:MFS transporter [Leucothrix arctica]|uniref:MFS transporter n=1 Tax=Leucothrix arctica TaxID=1481894 RepID=A0A317CAX6_9GAMM|nr:MFS transporter [Leucothrix arctica]PWQ95519.1 MFS transporter [Leucothrix arctica]